MSTEPINLTPDEAAEFFRQFESREAGGLNGRSIVEFMSYLLATGGIRLLDSTYQKMAALFIAESVLDFEGNIYVDLSELDGDDYLSGGFVKGSGS